MPKDNVYPGSRDVDAYMATAPNAAQPMLRELRQLIREAAPAAKEKMSYGMPLLRASRTVSSISRATRPTSVFTVPPTSTVRS